MAANAPKNSPHYVGKSALEFNKALCDDEGKMIIPWKDLNIVWGKDNRYWNLPDDDHQKPAELNQVYWLEVTGSVGNTDPGKEYEVGFRVSLTPDAFGWVGSPLYVMVKRGKEGKFGWKKFLLDPDEDEAPTERDIIGKLTNSNEDNKESDDAKIYFGIYEVWSGKWKGGLKIHHAFVKEL